MRVQVECLGAVFVAERRGGLLGRVLGELLLATMWLGFHVLRDEDGRIYDNIRFHTQALLPMDGPIGRYVGMMRGYTTGPDLVDALTRLKRKIERRV